MNTVAIIGRMLLALVLVLGIMWALARWARKPMGAGKTDRVMSVLARQQLSRTSSVTVLQVMDRALVLGVTEHGIRLITETDLGPIADALATEATPARSWPRLRLPAQAATEAIEASPDTDGSDGSEGSDELSTPAAFPARTNLPARIAQPGRPGGALAGSVLSPQTWRQVINSARELTVRR